MYYWTLGCGLLMVTSIVIAAVGLIVALQVRDTATALHKAGLDIQQRMVTLAVIDGADDAHNETLVANCSLPSAVDSATCVCRKLGCSVATGSCALAPTHKLNIACAPCATEGLPCYLHA
jgi:hypothetical protein